MDAPGHGMTNNLDTIFHVFTLVYPIFLFEGYLSAIDGVFSWYASQVGARTKFPQSILLKTNDPKAAQRLGSLLDPQLARSCLNLSNACLTLMGCPALQAEGAGNDLSSLVSGCMCKAFCLI